MNLVKQNFQRMKSFRSLGRDWVGVASPLKPWSGTFEQ